MKRILMIVIALLLCCVYAMAYTVVIDPGHGGRDVGAVGRVSREKDINLKVALALGRLIKKNYPGIKVVYTRSKDAFVGLDRRAAIANKAKADLFISIHTNSTAAAKIEIAAASSQIQLESALADFLFLFLLIGIPRIRKEGRAGSARPSEID